MNEIQKERIYILKTVISQIENYETVKTEFADREELKRLVIKRNELWKTNRPTIWSLVPHDDPRRKDQEREESETNRIKLIIKALDIKIKKIEIEMIIYYGVYELHEFYEEIWKRLHHE